VGQDPGAQLFGHSLYVADGEVEFLRALLVRQVQAHEVEAPDPQRLMMASENGSGEFIEACLAGQTTGATGALPVPLPLGMARHLVTPAPRAMHALKPAQAPTRLETPDIVDQGLEVDQVRHEPQ
jgi:hypothetical protein